MKYRILLVLVAAAFLFGAILAYDPARGFLARRNNPGG